MKRNGFTLVEILVVIALVATISVILGINLMKTIGNSEKFEEKELAKDLEEAAYVYVAETPIDITSEYCVKVKCLIDNGYLDDEKGLLKKYDKNTLNNYSVRVYKEDNEKTCEAYKSTDCTGTKLGD